MSNSQAVSVFNFKSNNIRVVADDKGEPWFLANDVCTILGYANPRDAIAKHCRTGGVAKRDTPTESGNQEMTWINEGNLYRLIIKSRKPEAEPFEAWVCDDVLPSIRKTGGYQVPTPPANPHLALRNAVHAAAKGSRQAHSNIYNSLYRKFQVTSYKEISAEQCVAAIEFIRSLEGDYIPRDKIAAPKPSLALCDGQHYVVAKDGEVLLHKVLSSDINDSFLKQKPVDTLAKLKYDLGYFIAPENPRLEMDYCQAQDALTCLSTVVNVLERNGLQLGLMYQQTQFVSKLLSSYWTRLDELSSHLISIRRMASVQQYPSVVTMQGVRFS